MMYSCIRTITLTGSEGLIQWIARLLGRQPPFIRVLEFSVLQIILININGCIVFTHSIRTMSKFIAKCLLNSSPEKYT